MAEPAPTESPPVPSKPNKVLDKLVAKAKESSISVSRHHLNAYLHEAALDPSLAWDLVLEDHANRQQSVIPADGEPQVVPPEVEEIVKAWEDAEQTHDEVQKQRKLEDIIHRVKTFRSGRLTTRSHSTSDRPDKRKLKQRPIVVQYNNKQLADQLLKHGCIDGSVKKLNKEPLEDATLNLLKRHDQLLARYKCVRALLFGVCDSLELSNTREVVENLCNGNFNDSQEALQALMNKAGDAFVVESTEEEDKVVDISDRCYAALSKIEQDRRGREAPSRKTDQESAILKESNTKHVVPEVSRDGTSKQSKGTTVELSAENTTASNGGARKRNVQKAKNGRKK